MPRFFRAVGDNFICLSAPRSAEIDALRLGDQSWLFFPAELTFAAATRIETSGVRALSLSNGYLGYVEIPERVATVNGESRRQYFEAPLLETLHRAANTALAALRPR